MAYVFAHQFTVWDLYIIFKCSHYGQPNSYFCLAISQNVSDNSMELLIHVFTLIYNISEIFMITYLGNEIMLSSDNLSYRLFESDWIDQTRNARLCVIIFGEYLKKSQVMVIGKLYPLTLETFMTVG